MSKRNRKNGMPNLEAIERGIREEVNTRREETIMDFLTGLEGLMIADGRIPTEYFSRKPIPRGVWPNRLVNFLLKRFRSRPALVRIIENLRHG